MTVSEVITALCLPADTLVNQRVPKKLLLENGAPTGADKRQINEGIEELTWVAALKPGTIGVPEFRDGVREYLEIAVLSLTLRPEAKAVRLVELIHRAIPYPVFLVAEQAGTVSLSLAHKRLAQNEAGRVVLDDAVLEWALDADARDGNWLAGLSVAAQPRASLLSLYQGWVACLEAFQAARISGRLSLQGDATVQEERRKALPPEEDIKKLERRVKSEEKRIEQKSGRLPEEGGQV